MQFREDDCRMRKGHASYPVVDRFNQGSTLQQNFRPNVAIEMLRDRIGRQSWILASALP